MDEDSIRRDERQFPLEVIELAGDALRLMTGDDDPFSRREETMSEDEQGGPYLMSSARRELSRANEDEYVDESWSREPYPVSMRETPLAHEIGEALIAVEEEEEEEE